MPPHPQAYPVALDDPLAEAHAAVSAWLEAAVRSRRVKISEEQVPLKTLPAGRALLAAPPERVRACVLAALVQVQFWDHEFHTIQAEGIAEVRARCPGIIFKDGSLTDQSFQRHFWALTALTELLHQRLPWRLPDLITLVRWCLTEDPGHFTFPVGAVTGALERYATESPLGPELTDAVEALAAKMAASRFPRAHRLAQDLGCLAGPRVAPDPEPTAARQMPVVGAPENLRYESGPTLPPDPMEPAGSRAATRSNPLPLDRSPTMPDPFARPEPAPVGTPHVLTRLKLWAKIPLTPAEEAATIKPVASDGFPVADASPLRAEHEWLGTLFRTLAAELSEQERQFPEYIEYSQRVFKGQPLGGRTLDEFLVQDKVASGRLLLAAAEREVDALLGPDQPANLPHVAGSRAYIHALFCFLLDADNQPERYELDRDGLFDIELFLFAQHYASNYWSGRWLSQQLVKKLKATVASRPLTAGERSALTIFRENQIENLAYDDPPNELAQALTSLLGDGMEFFLNGPAFWTDTLNRDLTQLEPAAKAAWVALFKHAATATATQPTEKWLKTAQTLVAAISPDGELVQQSFARWLPLCPMGLTSGMLPLNRNWRPENFDNWDWSHRTRIVLRGFLWLAPSLPRPDELTEAIAAVALWAFEKVPGHGPRVPKVAKTAVACLAAIPSQAAVAQLARLRREVKHKPAHKELDAALATAAALGLIPAPVEEPAAPTPGRTRRAASTRRPRATEP